MYLHWRKAEKNSYNQNMLELECVAWTHCSYNVLKVNNNDIY